jgi:uncharacterized membrane protein YeaQ/YmgE (transglycosylase-associated protein family)
MGLLTMLLFGAIAGVIASYIMHTDTGIVMDIVLGVVGAFVGSLIMNALGAAGTTGFDIYSLIVAVIGAVVVIALQRMFFRRSIYY